MKNILSHFIFVFILTALAPNLLANEQQRIDHFKGKEAATLAAAMQNFKQGNQRLAALLDGGINPKNAAEIHQLTYTLEVALAKIKAEVNDLANVLEEVHLASETYDKPRLLKNAETYLKTAKDLAP